MEQRLTLKELREENGKSRAEIASALGVTVNAVGKYEAGIRRVNLEQVLILAKLYDCTATEIIKAQLNSCPSDR